MPTPKRAPSTTTEPRYERSRALHERARGVLAGGVSSEFRKAGRPHPLFWSHGRGARVVDVDGNEFLDFTLSQGPLILGHSRREVLAAVAAATARAQLVAGQHLDELELAELLQRRIPCAERLRFSLSGSEADHAALRLARAATGRAKVLRFEGHYHGWFDGVAVGIAGAADAIGPREAPTPAAWTAGLTAGARDDVIVLPWNDLALVERVMAERGHEIAAVITEPVMANNGCIEPAPGFLAGLRALCDRHGSLLIFDEVITGFRMGLGGAQRAYRVTPDLAVFGKAMASGWPISVLCGRERWMRLVADGVVIHAGTMNSGNPSVAAALATVRLLERERVAPRLRRLGRRLMAGLRRAAKRVGAPLLVQGPGALFHAGFTTLPAVRDYRDTLSYDKALYAAFVDAMQRRRIRLIGRGLWYVSAAHDEADIDACVAAAEASLREVWPSRTST